MRLKGWFMNSSLLWRKAVSSDAEILTIMVNGAYRGESSRQGWTTEAALIGGQRIDSAHIVELIGLRDSAILVAAQPDGRLVGCVHLQKKSPSVCYLGMLTVEAAIQRGGIGSFLMGASEEFALREFASAAIEMTVISVRKELIDWYVRRGFRVTGERRPFPYGETRFGEPFVDDLVFDVLVKKI
jgi:ribosomal protein S18 acetylase RimI-like enzyme